MKNLKANKIALQAPPICFENLLKLQGSKKEIITLFNINKLININVTTVKKQITKTKQNKSLNPFKKFKNSLFGIFWRK